MGYPQAKWSINSAGDPAKLVDEVFRLRTVQFGCLPAQKCEIALLQNPNGSDVASIYRRQ
jgi:hypothetical protein